MNMIDVELFAPMIKNIKSGTYQFPEGCTLKAFIKDNGINIPAESFFLINSRRVSDDVVLKKNDKITVLLIMSGG